MSTPVHVSIPTETKGLIDRFTQELHQRLLPHASMYKYQALLRLLDHDPIPKSPGPIEEEDPGLEVSCRVGSDILLMQANRSFQEWKQLSIDLLADKNSQSESIISNETERLKKEIEARAVAQALTDTGSSSESTKPDASWLNQCMTYRKAWRPSRGRSRQNSEPPPSLVRQANEADVVSTAPPSGRHLHRVPSSPINGQSPPEPTQPPRSVSLCQQVLLFVRFAFARSLQSNMPSRRYE
ncbi:hypothetical protein FS837_011970 [Tulasnella sp. UAMH 9824]|nr:hypothetical protein FS837_011970 [Tulasnella sp. UAMH 9824]